RRRSSCRGGRHHQRGPLFGREATRGPPAQTDRRHTQEAAMTRGIGKLDNACQTGRHPHRDRGHDAYSTPPIAVDALLRVETLPHYIWEPAAGHGPIVTVLREAGHRVIASDILHYDFELDFESDFLEVTKAPAGVEAIVSNPPFMLATEFVEHALKLCPRVIMLCRLGFLESRRRTGILDNGALAAIHCFIE